MSIETEIRGEPGSILEVAAWVTERLAPALQRGADAMAAAMRAADGEWRGETGSAFVAAMRRGTTGVDGSHAMTARVAATIADYGNTLRSLQARMSEVRRQAAIAGLTVSGFVVEDPGPGPAHPETRPDAVAPDDQTTYDRGIEAWNRHQDRIREYERLAHVAHEIWHDVERAWERVSAGSRALAGVGWTFALTDLAGGLAGAVVSANSSALRQTAQGMQANAQQHLARLRSMPSYPAQFAHQYYDDLRHYDDAVRAAGDDLSQATRMARIGKALPLGVGGALAGVGVWYDMEHNDEGWQQATTSNLGGLAASVATGAAVGTMIGGPVGTVAGVVVGGAVGVFTSGMIDGLWDHDGDLSDAVMAGADLLVDTGDALVEGASDVGGAIIDGIGGLFD